VAGLQGEVFVVLNDSNLMKRLLIIFISALSFVSLSAQRPASLNPYDLNRPIGWATIAKDGSIYNLTGGSGSAVTLISTGQDQSAEITAALKNNNVVVLDGSNGDFLIGSGGVNWSSDKSKDRTLVGINGATLRQMNSVTQFHSYLDARTANMVSHSGGYVTSVHDELQSAIDENVAEKGTSSKWYVKEGDELYVRGYIMDYLYENGMSAEEVLSEPVKQWGVFRINGNEEKGSGSNLIIRNINFVGPGALDMSGLDAFCLTNCHNVWVDHCSFSDGLDGCFDITSSSTGTYHSTNITISWCTFNYGPSSWNHRFCSLFNGNEAQTLNVTVANCIWGGGIYMRTPLCNHANVHQVNCLFDAPGPGLRAQNSSYNDSRYAIFMDHCYFAAGQNGSNTRTYVTLEHNGKTCYNQCEGNYFANGEEPISNATMTIPYEYEPIPAALVPSVLTSASGAGPTLTDPLVFGN